VEYRAFMDGIDFKLQWNKKLKQFELLVPESNSEYWYQRLIEFEMGDIRNKCVIRIQRFQDYGMFLDMLSEIEDSVKVTDTLTILEIKVEAITEDQIRTVLDKLEKVHYFDRWR